MAIDWANLKTTSAEREAVIHNAVNAYYEHALNDKSMSHDEVMESTAEMAEKGLTYLDEANQAEQAENISGEIDSGIDGGE